MQFGLFHGDPHPGNIFAMPDGRIAYVDFGNVAELSQANKQVLIDAIVHAVNEDYEGMADDFIKLVSWTCVCISAMPSHARTFFATLKRLRSAASMLCLTCTCPGFASATFKHSFCVYI